MNSETLERRFAITAQRNAADAYRQATDPEDMTESDVVWWQENAARHAYHSRYWLGLEE